MADKLDNTKINWALYRYLHGALKLGRVYCYFTTIKSRSRAMAFIRRWIVNKPTGI